MTVSEILTQIRDDWHLILPEDLVDDRHDLLVLLLVTICLFCTSWLIIILLLNAVVGVALIQHFPLFIFIEVYFLFLLIIYLLIIDPNA